MIRGIGAEEVLRHAGEFLGAIRGERLAALIGPPPLPLGREHRSEVAVVRQFLRPANDSHLELAGIITEHVVDEVDLPGVTRANGRQPVGELERGPRADTPRERVGPVFGPESPPMPL